MLEPGTLGPALEGIELAYYLVHSMGRGGDGDFVERDRRGAENFARAASEAGVGRIVYLGGLGEGKSDHLRSRHETAEALASTGIPLTYFRAAVVVGSGSESLVTIAYLVKRLPAMVTPSWTSTRTQPIAARDVVAYLAAAPDVPESTGREIEIGGPDVTTYGGMLDLAADARACAGGRGSGPGPLTQPQLALDRAGDARRHRRGAAAGRGPDHRDRRRGPERDGALRRRADAARAGHEGGRAGGAEVASRTMAEPRYEEIAYERRGPVTVITIDRPERMNAIDGATAAELVDAWDRFRPTTTLWSA